MDQIKEDGEEIYQPIIVTTEKLISPGNHSRVPPPESRLGPDGKGNYTHDPKFLINNPPAFYVREDEKDVLCMPLGEGIEQDFSTTSVQKIRNHIETSTASRDVKLFCAIYTEGARVDKTNGISETWGKRCDGFLFASDHTNLTDGHMHLPGDSKYGFDYSSIYQRVQAMKAYIYDEFLDDYDFFHFCGDDTYMIIENMKEFLASDKVQSWDNSPDKVFIGGEWTHWEGFGSNYPSVGKFYLNGAPGYTLSRKALKAYVEGPLESCKYIDGAQEDRHFSECLWSSNYTMDNAFLDTRDEVGAHRYHPLSLPSHSAWPSKVNFALAGAERVYMNRVISQSLKYLEEEFGFPYVVEDDYVSKSSVMFHRYNALEMKRMEMLLYKNIDEEC